MSVIFEHLKKKKTFFQIMEPNEMVVLLVMERLWRGIVVLFPLILPPANATTQNSLAHKWTYGYAWWIQASGLIRTSLILLIWTKFSFPQSHSSFKKKQQKQIILMLSKIKTYPDKIQVIL